MVTKLPPTAGAEFQGKIAERTPLGGDAGTPRISSQIHFPSPNKFPVGPMARQVNKISNSQPTFVWAATLSRRMARLSNTTDDVIRTSNRAVPGVVMTLLILPEALILIDLPTSQKFGGNVINPVAGMHLAAAAAVRVGPSPGATINVSCQVCWLIF